MEKHQSLKAVVSQKRRHMDERPTMHHRRCLGLPLSRNWENFSMAYVV